jgi:hypothetical protein
MNENNLGELQKQSQIKEIYDPLRLCRISGRVRYPARIFFVLIKYDMKQRLCGLVFR